MVGDDVVAVARAVADTGWAGVFGMATLPEARGKGAARSLLAALAGWAGTHDADRMYLQVERDNTPALRLYERAGFREICRYHYRSSSAEVVSRALPVSTAFGACADHPVRPSVCLPGSAGRRQSRQDGAMAGPDRRDLGRVFNEVPELYDRIRPGYPDELFADLVTITGMHDGSSILEVGCGTGQATRSLAALGCSVTAVEAGAEMAALARRRLAAFGNVSVETSTFEEWDDRGARFDLLVAASAWHWVDPSIGWQRAHDVLYPGGWMALLGHVVVRRPGEPEMYAETADLHERFCPGNPDWCHPPLEDDVRATDEGWGLVDDPGGLFGPTIVRWYPSVQWLNGNDFADLLRSTSLYRKLDRNVREPLLDAIAERIRTRMGDRAARRYLSVLRVAQRAA